MSTVSNVGLVLAIIGLRVESRHKEQNWNWLFLRQVIEKYAYKPCIVIKSSRD